MVKFGEFSPLNPDLQCTGKSLLSLGEYEEKRRILLEKMKREYREQMAQARALQKTGTLTGNHLRGCGYMKNAVNLSEFGVYENQNENSGVTNFHSESQISQAPASYGQFDILAEGGSLPFIPTSQEMNNLEHPADKLSLPPLSPGTLSISARDRKLADLRQSFSAFSERPLTPLTPRNDSLAALSRKSQDLYQEQLRQQIEEKRKLEAEKREQEKKEEEAIMRRLEKQQEQMRREFEREEAQRKALAEKRARQMKEVLQRQEELEREAVELRKKTRWNLENQQDCHHVCLESLPLSAVKVKSLHIPIDTFKSGRCKKQLKGHQSTDNPVATMSVTSTEQLRNICDGEATMHLKLYGSEKQWLKEVGKEMHRETNHLSPPTRDHQPSDQKENCINVQFQNDRTPLKMFHDLASDHNLEDTLPIPVFRSRSPAVHHRTSLELVSFSTTPRRYSEDMQRLVSKWQVPAVQKNNLQTTERFHQTRHNNELTQLGAFRRQLQMEQLRMDEMLRQQQNVKKP